MPEKFRSTLSACAEPAMPPLWLALEPPGERWNARRLRRQPAVAASCPDRRVTSARAGLARRQIRPRTGLESTYATPRNTLPPPIPLWPRCNSGAIISERSGGVCSATRLPEHWCSRSNDSMIDTPLPAMVRPLPGWRRCDSTRLPSGFSRRGPSRPIPMLASTNRVSSHAAPRLP